MGAAPSTPSEVVDAYHRAWTTGDIGTAMSLVDDDVVVSAPNEEVRTREDWQAYIAGFAPRLTGAPLVTRLVDGDHVALWYLPQTAVTTTTQASELFTVRDGRITEIRLVFDRPAYVPPGQEPR